MYPNTDKAIYLTMLPRLRRAVISLSDTYLFVTRPQTAECACVAHTHNAPLQGRLRTPACISLCVSVLYATVHGWHLLLLTSVLLITRDVPLTHQYGRKFRYVFAYYTAKECGRSLGTNLGNLIEYRYLKNNAADLD